ncbi:putative reductase [Nostocoides australiense Ben110]|uniref:Putative reductase n=1 Tax=Nostocoides australiense Ben110 TaxID=1193182 RepID=W6JWM3_9MICO|nr:flavin reductase family protein [Tetrasphaera australiensis]MCA0290209.1 flavin reductase family protein [Actinomycetota bacterium]CCH73958.1 putative reductase [Tetrasphaera australiensis Ben110]
MTAYRTQPAGADDFRAVMSRLVSGVVLLSAHHDGHDHAMTATAFTSVSLDPPLVLACVEQAARFHELVTDSGVWGVSLLGRKQRAAAEWLATPGRPLVGQFDAIPHWRAESGVLLFTGSLATLEARTTAIHQAGDHSIIVGEVIATGLDDDPDDALVHYRSRYGSIA